MVSIKEESDRISKQIIKLREEYSNSLKLVNEQFNETAKELRLVAAEGDLSENAAYSEARDKLIKLKTQIFSIQESLDSLDSLPTNDKYVPKDFIGVFSTFRIKNKETQEIKVYKVFPGAISDPCNSIMSSEAPIYKKLQGMRANEIITVKHRASGQDVTYEILEVY